MFNSNEKYFGRVKHKIEYFGYILDIFEDERIVKIFEVKGGRRIEKRMLIRGKIGQVVGEQHFMLFEVMLKENSQIKVFDRVYIGPGPKANIEMIIQKIDYNALTEIAKSRLEEVIRKIIKDTENKWVNFFNVAGPITPKLHVLELLPHIGKKKMWIIIREREVKPFTTFKDIEERTGIDPVKAICGRIIEEIVDNQKYHIFVYKPKQPK